MSTALLRALGSAYAARLLPGLLGSIAIIAGVPIGFVLLLKMDGTEFEGAAIQPLSFQMAYLLGGGLMLLTPVFAAHQGARRLSYTLPMSTRAFATWQMVSSGLTMAGASLVCTVLINESLGAGWPILGPTLFLGTAGVVACSVYWNLLDFRIWKLVVAGLVGVGGVVWLQSRYLPWLQAGPLVPWRVSALDVFVLALVNVVAHRLGVVALVRSRHGRGAPQRDMEQLARSSDDDLLAMTTAADVEHATPVRAAEWLFWARSRLAGAGAALLFSLMLLLPVAGMIYTGRPTDPAEVLGMTVALSIFAGVLAGMADPCGLGDRGRTREGLRAYVSAMPLSDRDLGAAVLRNAMWTSILCAGVVLGVSLLSHVMLLAMFGPGHYASTEFGRGWIVIPACVLLCFVVSWAALGVSTSVAVTGRPWFFLTVFCGGLASVTVGGIILVFFVPDALKPTVNAAGLIGVTVLFVAGTIVAHARAWWCGLIGGGSVLISALLWAAAAAALVPWMTSTGSRAFAICACCHVALPRAAIPLAMAWNRHR